MQLSMFILTNLLSSRKTIISGSRRQTSDRSSTLASSDRCRAIFLNCFGNVHYVNNEFAQRTMCKRSHVKYDCNSWKLTQMLMLKSKTWRSIIATEEKCRQSNWCFRYMVIINQDRTFYLKCLWNEN